MADQKSIKLVQALYNGTLDGRVNWVKAPVEGSFLAAFSTYSVLLSKEVRVSRLSNQDDTLFIIGLQDKNGELIDEITDETFDEGELDPYLTFSFLYMQNLYEAARRKAMGVDDAMDSILGDLFK